MQMAFILISRSRNLMNPGKLKIRMKISIFCDYWKIEKCFQVKTLFKKCINNKQG